MAMNGQKSWLLLQNLCRRKFQTVTKPSAPAIPKSQQLQDVPGINWRVFLKEGLRSPEFEDRSSVCIYRVPSNMREVEPKAYKPNVISIGPYHRGKSRLQEMEGIKRKFVSRLFNQTHTSGNEAVQFEPVIEALVNLEQDARNQYAEKIKFGSDEFVEMMLIDGCFVVEFLRELEKNRFRHGSGLIERWMLPTVRRDLIMLENQLPMFVLQELFNLTRREPEQSGKSLQELAIRYFAPLIQSPSMEIDSELLTQSGENHDLYYNSKHLLDLFRSRILPAAATEADNTQKEPENNNGSQETVEEVEIRRIRPMKELRKAAVIIEKGKNCLPLQVRSEGRALIIHPVYINDYKGTLFRNIMAFEQRHSAHRPQVTAYFFFLNGLVDMVEDVEFLHRQGIIEHSLGCHKDVTDLVNSVCKEVARNTLESYLKSVLCDINHYMTSPYAKFAGPVIYHYWGNQAARISTYLSLTCASLLVFLRLVEWFLSWVFGSEIALSHLIETW